MNEDMFTVKFLACQRVPYVCYCIKPWLISDIFNSVDNTLLTVGSSSCGYSCQSAPQGPIKWQVRVHRVYKYMCSV